jgi:hypothetical protein
MPDVASTKQLFTRPDDIRFKRATDREGLRGTSERPIGPAAGEERIRRPESDGRSTMLHVVGIGNYARKETAGKACVDRIRAEWESDPNFSTYA